MRKTKLFFLRGLVFAAYEKENRKNQAKIRTRKNLAPHDMRMQKNDVTAAFASTASAQLGDIGTRKDTICDTGRPLEDYGTSTHPVTIYLPFF